MSRGVDGEEGRVTEQRKRVSRGVDGEEGRVTEQRKKVSRGVGEGWSMGEYDREC